MAVVSMKQFIESGVHFGHQTRRWHPKMKPYIFGTKNGVHIIDLQKSLRKLREAYEFVRDLSARGETILFVGTKPQAREIIAEEARRCGAFYINERWLGGLLTNFNTVKVSIAKLKRLEDMRGEDGTWPGVIKKEAVRLERQREKLERALGGIKEMRKLPGATFIIDCRKERIAVQESHKLGVPIVAVVDTNVDPEYIAYPIPGNDDAIRAIRLFASTIASAVVEGRGLYEAQLRSTEEDKPKQGRGARTSRAARGTRTAAEAGEAASARAAATEAQPAEQAPAQPAEASGEAAPAAEPKPEPAGTPEPKAEPAATPEPEAQPEPGAKAEPAPEPKAEPAAEAEPAPKAEPEAQPEPEAKAEPAPEPKPEPAAEAEPAKAKAESGPESGAAAGDEAPAGEETGAAGKSEGSGD